MYIILYLIVAFVLTVLLLKQLVKGKLGVCNLKTDLTGKWVLITGGNTGIGRITAIELAKRKATVIIACRDLNKGHRVVKEVAKLGYIKPILVKLDLGDLRSVKKCVEGLSSVRKIDILINNAAVMATTRRELSHQYHELHFGINHLGHFYLTKLLLPKLKEANNPRVINISALAHAFGDIYFDDIYFDKWANSALWPYYYTAKAYAQSKLCNILHAQLMSKKYGLKAISLHPGIINTELLRYQLQLPVQKFFYKVFGFVIKFINKSPLEGAQTTLYCALEDYDKLIDGAYYSDCVQIRAQNTTREKAERLWDLSEKCVRQFEMQEKLI